MNGLTYAYIGDAYYELCIRDYLLTTGITIVNKLHQKAINFTSAIGQAKSLDYIYGLLDEEEVTMFKRGRNATTNRKAKNADLATYHKSTGFESLIGYLHLNKKTERLEFLINKSIEIILENES